MLDIACGTGIVARLARKKLEASAYSFGDDKALSKQFDREYLLLPDARLTPAATYKRIVALRRFFVSESGEES